MSPVPLRDTISKYLGRNPQKPNVFHYRSYTFIVPEAPVGYSAGPVFQERVLRERVLLDPTPRISRMSTSDEEESKEVGAISQLHSHYYRVRHARLLPLRGIRDPLAGRTPSPVLKCCYYTY